MRGWSGVVVEFAQRVDARGGDHAAIADQHELDDAALVLDDLDDLGERFRGVGAPPKPPYPPRAPLRIKKHPVFDRLAPFFAVGGVAARSHLTAPAGHPR